MAKMYYVIKDKQTDRFLSCRSLFMDCEGELTYITYTGKIGTDFFVNREVAEDLLNELNKVMTKHSIKKDIYIDEVDPDTLPLGVRFTEMLAENVC